MARTVVPEKVEEAKERILSASIDLILESGLAGFTLSQVADRAGITKAAIYWYYKNKEELLNAMTASIKSLFFEEAKQIAMQPTTPKHKIGSLIRSLQDSATHKRCFLLVKVFLELFSLDDGIKKLIQESYKEYIGMIADIFGEGIQKKQIKTELDQYVLARLFCAALDGCVIHDVLIEKADYSEIYSFFITSLFKDGDAE
jgi:AcrR family transcriptional regulator